MRVLVLLLLVAIMPMRLWASGGMEMRMARMAAGQGEVAAAAAMPADCWMAAAATGDSGDGASSSPMAHCLSCDLCGTAACPPATDTAPALAPSIPPESRHARYAGLARAPDLRPPIA